MNPPDQPVPPSPGFAGRRVSGTTLVLALALAVSTTAAIAFGVLYFTAASHSDSPYRQHGSVAPQGKFKGEVLYPVPYRPAPNLTISAGKRSFKITRQDGQGFAWEAEALPQDIKDDKGFGAERLARQYPLWYLWSEGYLGQTAPAIEDFRWEAAGLRATETERPRSQ